MYVYAWAENIVGKGQNAGNKYFLLFPTIFSKVFFLGSLKIGICGKELKARSKEVVLLSKAKPDIGKHNHIALEERVW